MLLARVDGSAVTTICHPTLVGRRLAICQQVDEAGGEIGEPFMAVDPLGAGLHQRVLATTDGRGIRERMGNLHSPVRYLIISIIDDPESSP